MGILFFLYILLWGLVVLHLLTYPLGAWQRISPTQWVAILLHVQPCLISLEPPSPCLHWSASPSLPCSIIAPLFLFYFTLILIDILSNSYQVTRIDGYGRVSGPNEVTVTKDDGSTEKVATKNILIAVGSEVTPFPGIDVSSEREHLSEMG